MKRIIRAGLALVAGLALLSTAAPAAATEVIDSTTPQCEAVFVDITAVKIQEDGQGEDEIFVRMNDVRYRLDGVALTFEEGQTRPGSQFRPGAFTFAGTLKLKVIEDDGIANDVWPPFITPVIVCPVDTALIGAPRRATVDVIIRQDIHYVLIFDFVRTA